MQTPTTAPADFAQALARLYPSLLKRAARLTHSSSEAQDLVHDTLERGLRRQESFRSGGEPDRWLGTIMRRAFIDRCRWARRWAFDAEAVETLLTPEPEEEAWWEGLDAADVRAAAAALRPPFRDVYCLFAFDHLSVKQIAERLDIPVRTVGTRLHRARLKLRAALETRRPGHLAARRAD